MARARWRRERAERLANPPTVDADTLRMRALHDRRGTLIRSGVLIRWHGDGLRVVPWEIRHSLRGRVNQVDCIRCGVLRRTCSLRTAERLLRF